MHIISWSRKLIKFWRTLGNTNAWVNLRNSAGNSLPYQVGRGRSTMHSVNYLKATQDMGHIQTITHAMLLKIPKEARNGLLLRGVLWCVVRLTFFRNCLRKLSDFKCIVPFYLINNFAESSIGISQSRKQSNLLNYSTHKEKLSLYDLI